MANLKPTVADSRLGCGLSAYRDVGVADRSTKTSLIGTFETWRQLPRMSVQWGAPEMTGEPRELRD
jgi:hypothetical protein